jgi:haloacetate dehalogenase
MDFPARVRKLAVLDIAPTREMYGNTTDRFARAYWHWFFLIQKAPFPEHMIASDPDGFWLTKCGGGSTGLAPFTREARDAYLAAFRDPEVIRATCEDYRAAATIDIDHDDADGARKVDCPVLALWGAFGVIESCFDCLALWRQRAENVRGEALPGGHYLAEELPDLVAEKLRAFFGE